MPSLSALLAGFCADLDPAHIGSDVAQRLCDTVLDGFASMLAGVPEPVSSQVLASFADTPSGACTIVGFRRRLPLREAALVNGTIAHACDYDDSSWTMWGHPTAPLLPALLACGESRGSSGQDLLTALAAGLEVEKTMGLVMQPAHYRRGWHPTATLGLFGATAGAGRLLGLDAAQLQAAFGIAASMAAGLRCNAGYGTKPLHTGLAARNGIEAALLARAGVTSNPDALDGEGGLIAVYDASYPDRIATAVARLGRPFEVMDPGLSPKLYPCCSDIHCAIDAFLDAKAEHGFDADDVAAIRCFVGSMALPNVRRRDPETPLEAKFSLSYCVACAAVHGSVGLPRFRQAALNDAAVQAFARRVTVDIDPALDEAGSETFSSASRVEIALRDGRTFSIFLREMRGHPQRPLTQAERVGKFRECAATGLSDDAATRLHQAISDLWTSPDILDLMRLTADKSVAHGGEG